MAGNVRRSWRVQLDELASRPDPLSDSEVIDAMGRALVGTAADAGNPESLANLMGAYGALRVQMKDANPADLNGFLNALVNRVEALNGRSGPGIPQIEWPEPREEDEDE